MKKSKTKKGIVIVVCILVLILIVGGIFLMTKPKQKENKNEYTADKNNYVIGSLEHKTFSVKSGTADFKVAISFKPNNSQAWAMNMEGCKYNVQALNQYNYCINQGWDSIKEDISTGTSIVNFESVEDGIGYAFIRINVPENVPACTQRISVEAKCNLYANENVKDYFNLEVTG